ncbi:hypothetical protein AGLY_013462 [Aphis glycines]|uniref:Uncharacterized protein n=1 Tax=Aphis glycines TaxID=307491 RepID=A0A6G0T6E3_APHGL|nr:hypothetical protein AGLY_013462 [Aphis glycines]
MFHYKAFYKYIEPYKSILSGSRFIAYSDQKSNKGWWTFSLYVIFSFLLFQSSSAVARYIFLYEWVMWQFEFQCYMVLITIFKTKMFSGDGGIPVKVSNDSKKKKKIVCLFILITIIFEIIIQFGCVIESTNSINHNLIHFLLFIPDDPFTVIILKITGYRTYKLVQFQQKFQLVLKDIRKV